MSDSTTAISGQSSREFFGHPRGLATLFFTEMWERFTYYGMRAILVLFLVAAVSEGGLGLDDRTGNAIYGLYISASYMLNLAGGWIADRLTGAQRAVWWGGILIMIGNGCLAAGPPQLFFLGLVIITFGTGLLKPNVSAMVAQLYPEGGSRRDAGFSIFYMGINLGAFLGSTLVPILAHQFGWHIGFGAPALGMLIGLVQFASTKHFLCGAGSEPGMKRTSESVIRNSWIAVGVCTALVFIIVAAAIGGRISIDPVQLLKGSFWVMVVSAAGYFLYLLFFAGLDLAERKRVLVMLALFIACAMFWAGYEQTGASLNLFTDRYTDRVMFGWEMPAGVLQAVNPSFIVIFSPIFAALWIQLGRRNMDLSAPAKFALGLIFMGVGFLVMFFASRYVVAGEKVLPTWLVLTYMFHTFGELCLSPVGLSSMSKLAPVRFVGQALGVWFLATAIGNNLAGQIAGDFDPNNLAATPGLFLNIFWWGVIGGAVMLAITPYAKKLMGGVK
jgi:proton-dependent oligopeptide transporter, POT family